MGVSGLRRHHRFWPESSTFHALVESGSRCMRVPLRSAPTRNQRKGGRRSGGSSGNMSSRKYTGLRTERMHARMHAATRDADDRRDENERQRGSS